MILGNQVLHQVPPSLIDVLNHLQPRCKLADRPVPRDDELEPVLERFRRQVVDTPERRRGLRLLPGLSIVSFVLTLEDLGEQGPDPARRRTDREEHTAGGLSQAVILQALLPELGSVLPPDPRVAGCRRVARLYLRASPMTSPDLVPTSLLKIESPVVGHGPDSDKLLLILPRPSALPDKGEDSPTSHLVLWVLVLHHTESEPRVIALERLDALPLDEPTKVDLALLRIPHIVPTDVR